MTSELEQAIETMRIAPERCSSDYVNLEAAAAVQADIDAIRAAAAAAREQPAEERLAHCAALVSLGQDILVELMGSSTMDPAALPAGFFLATAEEDDVPFLLARVQALLEAIGTVATHDG